VQFVEGVLRRRPSVTVTSTQLGETGLALAREEPPDLILLDLHLPDMGGDKVLRELQAASATRHVPVVILTADATNRHLDRLVRAGASGYLTKPISLRDLLGVVDEHLAPDAGHSSASTPHASASTQD